MSLLAAAMLVQSLVVFLLWLQGRRAVHEPLPFRETG